MSCVHKTAVIDSSADIGSDNTIGPYVVIDGHVKIGNNNIIDPASIITGNTTIGDNNDIHGHVYIGNLLQDLAHKGGSTFVRIGNNNIIREFTNVHRGTKEGSATIIGDNNYLMAYTPVRQVVALDTTGLSGDRINVSVYDPETCSLAGSYEAENTGRIQLVPHRDLDSLIIVDSM